MLMVWRGAMVAAALVAGFFALTFVFPLNTMGDPAYDIAMLRARWYGDGLIFVPHGIATLGAGWLAVRQHSLWALFAALFALATFAVFFGEEGRFIRYGSPTMPHEEAMPKLFLSRLATLGLSLLALFSLWRTDARG